MTAGPWVRVASAFLVAFAGLLVVGGLVSASSWCWLLFVGLGIAAGAIAGRGRDLWLVLVAAAALYPAAAWLGLPRADVEWLHWFALTLVGACLATAGFAIGVLVAGRARERHADGRPPRQGRAIGWPLLVAAVAVGLVGFGGWVGYAAVMGSEELVHPGDTWPHCGTPASAFGWAYEAINYDQADDARLAADNPGLRDCTTWGSQAGDAVVTSDGVPIAGWYIPAANGAGPPGPTLLIVPGWKSHKSEVLKYAPPFHESYNLVLLDLRNGGRSGGTETTWGLREQLDVRAMVDWLVRVKGPAWIGAMGNSMGAATVLAEAIDDPRVEALILDSMHASLATSLGDGLEYERHLPAFPSAWAMVAGASMRVGADLTAVDPVRTIGRLGDRPVLLIHGVADMLDRPENSAERNVQAAREAGVPIELRYCDPGWHGHVIDECPAEWAAWAAGFLTAAMAR
jgi:hypothetical protein